MRWFRLVYNWYIYAPFAGLQPMLNKCHLALSIIMTVKDVHYPSVRNRFSLLWLQEN